MSSLASLRKFVRSRPGFDFRNYGDATSYRADVRRVGQQLADAEHLIRFCELFNIEPDYSAFCGRLQPAGDGFRYIAGQYYCTEYRAAVAACCANAIWQYWRANMPERGAIDVGAYLNRKASAEFGRGIAKRWFW